MGTRRVVPCQPGCMNMVKGRIFAHPAIHRTSGAQVHVQETKEKGGQQERDEGEPSGAMTVEIRRGRTTTRTREAQKKLHQFQEVQVSTSLRRTSPSLGWSLSP